MEYIRAPKNDIGETFSSKLKEGSDKENLILYRGKHSFVYRFEPATKKLNNYGILKNDQSRLIWPLMMISIQVHWLAASGIGVFLVGTWGLATRVQSKTNKQKRPTQAA